MTRRKRASKRKGSGKGKGKGNGKGKKKGKGKGKKKKTKSKRGKKKKQKKKGKSNFKPSEKSGGSGLDQEVCAFLHYLFLEKIVAKWISPETMFTRFITSCGALIWL